MVLLTVRTVYFYCYATWCLSELLALFTIQCRCQRMQCLCSIALLLNRSNSAKVQATNQLRDENDENIIIPTTVAVNSRASLSAPQGASIAQNRKLPSNKRNNKQRGSAKTSKCECMGASEKVPILTG